MSQIDEKLIITFYLIHYGIILNAKLILLTNSGFYCFSQLNFPFCFTVLIFIRNKNQFLNQFQFADHFSYSTSLLYTYLYNW